MMRVLLCALGVSMAVGVASAGATEVVGRVSVIDGDTIEIHGERIRLEGIDAFESAQTCVRASVEWRCGQQAALALDDLLGQHTVRCEGEKHDRYRRLLATCFVGAANVNAWMVKHGWALAYTKYSSVYVGEEATARNQGVGVWGSTFSAPWDYRHRD